MIIKTDVVVKELEACEKEKKKSLFPCGIEYGETESTIWRRLAQSMFLYVFRASEGRGYEFPPQRFRLFAVPLWSVQRCLSNCQRSILVFLLSSSSK